MLCRNRDLFSKSPIFCPLLVVAGYKLKAWWRVVFHVPTVCHFVFLANRLMHIFESMTYFPIKLASFSESSQFFITCLSRPLVGRRLTEAWAVSPPFQCPMTATRDVATLKPAGPVRNRRWMGWMLLVLCIARDCRHTQLQCEAPSDS